MALSDSSENDDRLKDIHHHLSTNKSNNASTSTSWLPLESNPAIFTSHARSTSHLPQNWEFVDVIGFGGRDDLLLLSPTENKLSGFVAGAIFLFPTTDAIYSDRGDQKARLRKQNQRHHDVLSRTVFHVEQVKGFGNACGTIAATHVLLNTGLSSPDIPDPFNQTTGRNTSPLSAYKNICTITSPNTDNQEHDSLRRQRGEMLVQVEELRNISDVAAQNTASQTQCPDSGDTYLGHHYCAFVPVKIDEKVHVVELDGTKICPIDHGPIVEGNINNNYDNNAFLRAVANVVNRKWMALEPNRIDFSLMALVKKE